MAAINPGIIRFREVYQYDMLDVSFEIAGINLTGKTLFCQVRKDADSPAVLEFSEADGSLTKTVHSATSTTVRFLKTADEMTLPPLSVNTRPPIYYKLTIIMYTAAEVVTDTQTIVEGTMEVLPQISRLS